MKTALQFLLLATAVYARENPFAPSSLQGAGVSQMQPQTSIPLSAQKIQLPVDAVKLNKVSVTYQMIDGKIETRTFFIDKAIAPDKAIILEQK